MVGSRYPDASGERHSRQGSLRGEKRETAGYVSQCTWPCNLVSRAHPVLGIVIGILAVVLTYLSRIDWARRHTRCRGINPLTRTPRCPERPDPNTDPTLTTPASVRRTARRPSRCARGFARRRPTPSPAGSLSTPPASRAAARPPCRVSTPPAAASGAASATRSRSYGFLASNPAVEAQKPRYLYNVVYATASHKFATITVEAADAADAEHIAESFEAELIDWARARRIA